MLKRDRIPNDMNLRIWAQLNRLVSLDTWEYIHGSMQVKAMSWPELRSFFGESF
jgi:hypothetical protein